ncbi:ABC transporter substrate-binding protein [Actinomadura welshii]
MIIRSNRRRGRDVRRLAAISALAALVLVAAGCGSSGDDSGGATKVTFAGNLPVPPTATLLAVPESLGYFSDAGIEVTHQVTEGTIEGIQAVVAGRADFAIGGTTAAISGYASEKDLRIVSTFSSNYRIIVKDETPITTTQDLRGKKIGVQALASASYQFGRAFVSEAGMNPDNDVSFLPVGLGAQAAEALKSGEIDAFVTYTGAAEEVVRLVGGEFRSVESPLNNMPGTTSWITTKSFAEKNPEAVEGFLAAQYKAALYASTNPESAIRLFWEQYPDAKPDGDVKSALGTLVPTAQPGYADMASRNDAGVFGTLEMAEFQEVADTFAKYGLIENKVTMSDLVDFSFAEAASAKTDIGSIEAEAKAAG